MAAAGCAASLSSRAFAAVLPDNDRQLRLYNLHTGEKLKTTYWAEGQYQVDELAAVNYFLRDYRNDEVKQIDPRLLDQLCLLQHKLERNGTYQIISGYRSPQTNAWLRRHETGVAKRSLHMQGRAIDIRLPGIELTPPSRCMPAVWVTTPSPILSTWIQGVRVSGRPPVFKPGGLILRC